MVCHFYVPLWQIKIIIRASKPHPLLCQDPGTQKEQIIPLVCPSLVLPRAQKNKAQQSPCPLNHIHHYAKNQNTQGRNGT